MRKKLLLISVFLSLLITVSLINPHNNAIASCLETSVFTSCPDLYPISCDNTTAGNPPVRSCCELNEDCPSTQNGPNGEDEENNDTGSLGRIGEGEGLGPFSNIELKLDEAGSALENVLSTLVGVLTLVGGLWFFIQVLIGGLNWISAGGDPKSLENARNRITNGIIGLIIVIAAWALIGVMGIIFGLHILNPADIIVTLEQTVTGNETEQIEGNGDE